MYQLYLYLYKDPSWIKCAHLNHTLLGIFYIECVFIGVCICATHIISETWHDMTKTSKPVPNSCSYEKERERHGKNRDSYIDMCPNDHLKIELFSISVLVRFSWTLDMNCMEVFEENAYHENRSFWFFFISSSPYQVLSLKVGNTLIN